MKNILMIKSSVMGAASVSNRLLDQLIVDLHLEQPSLEIVVRDLDQAPIPHLKSTTVAAVGRPAPETPAAQPVRDLSDQVIAEIFAADIILIGAPMYNFGISSALKSWFDHVLRAGVTFTYGPDGPQGLVPPKPVFVVETRGGLYGPGPMASFDNQEPHLKSMLTFIGLPDAHFLRIEGLGLGGAETAIADAARQLEQGCLAELKKAA